MNKNIYQTAGQKDDDFSNLINVTNGIPKNYKQVGGKLMNINKTGTGENKVSIGVYHVVNGKKVLGFPPVKGTVPRKGMGGAKLYRQGGLKYYQEAGIKEDTRPIATRNINTDFFDPNFNLGARPFGASGLNVNFNPRLAIGPDNKFASFYSKGSGYNTVPGGDQARLTIGPNLSSSMLYKNYSNTYPHKSVVEGRNTLGGRMSFNAPIGNRGFIGGINAEAGTVLSGRNEIDDQSQSPYQGHVVNPITGNDKTYTQVGAGLGYYPKNKYFGGKLNIGYGSEGSVTPGLNYGATANWGPATFNINKGRHGIGGGFGVSLPIGGPSRRGNQNPLERQTGGMYGSNTLSAAGQGGSPQIGTTSTIVGRETDPALQEARMQGLLASTEGLNTQSQGLIDQTRQQESQDKMMAERAGMSELQNFQSASNAGIGAVSRGAQMIGNQVDPGQNPNTWAGAYQAGKTAYDLSQAANLAGQGTQMIDGMNVITDAAKAGQAAQLATDAGGFIGSSADAANTGTIVLDAAGNTVNAGSTAGNVASAVGSAMPWGTIASYAGKGLSNLADDDDPTKSNVGEYAGKMVERAGQGATVGSFFPGPGTAIGAGIGAIVGGVEQAVGTKKARRAESEYEAEATANRNKGIYDLNKRVGSLYGSHLSNIAAGNLAQKTISGQNLGRNVMYQQGGKRAPKSLDRMMDTAQNFSGSRNLSDKMDVPFSVAGQRFPSIPSEEYSQLMQNRITSGDISDYGVLRSDHPVAIQQQENQVRNKMNMIRDYQKSQLTYKHGGRKGMMMGMPRYGYNY